MIFNFFTFMSMFELFQGLANNHIELHEAESEQENFVHELERLKNKSAMGNKLKKIEKDVLNNANILFQGREIIIDAFKKLKFTYTGTQYNNEIDKLINEDNPIRINNELFQKHVKYSEPMDMVKNFLEWKR